MKAKDGKDKGGGKSRIVESMALMSVRVSHSVVESMALMSVRVSCSVVESMALMSVRVRK